MGSDSRPRLTFSSDLRGLPWHFHGEVFNERASGRKLWLFYKPGSKVGKAAASHMADGDSSLSWVLEELPKLKESHRPFVCMQRPGEIMALNEHVWHLTLNI